jgi:hypothetical protein
MNDRNLHRPNEDAFFDYTDRMAAGEHPVPGNDLEATATRIQQALRANQPEPPAMPRHLKQSLWEDIMHTTTFEHASGIPNTRIVRNPFPRPYPRMMWTGAANLALAVLIVAALFGAWRGLQDSGGPSDLATLPAITLQESTPQSTTPGANVAAAATPITACDLSGDIPLAPDMTNDEPPFAMTSLYVVHADPTSGDPRGVLRLGCPGQESVTLAENVTSVWAGPWPGTVGIVTMPPGVEDPAAATTSFVDVRTGRMVRFGVDTGAMQLTHTVGSPWVFGPSPDDSATLAVADLRTMEIQPLAEVIGVAVPADAILLASTPANDGTLAIGFAHPYSESADSGTLQQAQEADGDLAILGNSSADARWIDVPDSLPRIGAISLSPDGTHAAVTSMGEGGLASESYRYGLIDLAGGSLAGQSGDISSGDNPSVAWVQEGSAIAYLANSRLETLAIDGGGQPAVAFEADSQLYSLKTTWNPDVVVASTHRDHGSDASATETEQDMVYSVDISTGAVHEFTGLDASATVGWITDASALVMYQWEDANPESTTYIVFDPVTGDQIGEIADAPPVQVSERTRPTLGPNSSTISADGTAEVIALGTQHIYAFVVGDGGLTMSRIESPEGMLSESFLTATIFLSPDGSLLSLTGDEDEGRTRYMTSLDDPESGWTGFENIVPGEGGDGLITFVATDPG